MMVNLFRDYLCNNHQRLYFLLLSSSMHVIMFAVYVVCSSAVTVYLLYVVLNVLYVQNTIKALGFEFE